MHVTTIGLDLAKNVFQVHGAGDDGSAVVRKKLRRPEVLSFFSSLPPCLVGLEACGSAHYWARELVALGHEVRLMPPRYVKPYVKREKNDAADAEAICEAVRRPSMRFVPIKTAEQQSALIVHKTRDLLVRQRARLVNALRSHLAEFGVIAAKGMGNVKTLVSVARDKSERRIPPMARTALLGLITALEALDKQIDRLEIAIKKWHHASSASQRLATIPGIGPITASAIAATVPDPQAFRSARHFAAWVGLTPRQNSSGGKDRLGGISKQGNAYIRRLLYVGAVGVLRYARGRSSLENWILSLITRRPARVVTTAVANKMARIAWAVLAHETAYRAEPAAAA